MPINSPQDRILQQLRLAREEMPEWAEVLDLQIDLLEAQAAISPPAVVPLIDAEEATLRRRQGVPLVTGRELALDWELFSQLYRQVCQIGAQNRADLAAAFADLGRMPAGNSETVKSWVAQVMAESRVPPQSDEAGLKTFVIINTLRPFLRRYAEAYAPLVDEPGWLRGYCPICGGEPDMAALSAEDEGARHLLCSRCDFEWRYKRLGCPFCESSDHKKLAYYPEQDGPHRLYVCHGCQRYLKAIDLRSGPPRGRVLLPVERVLTMGMDVAAREQGFE